MGVISSDTKIPIRDIIYIIGITLWLAQIQSSISELRLTIKGRMNLHEWRLDKLDGGESPMSAITTKAPSVPSARKPDDDDDQN